MADAELRDITPAKTSLVATDFLAVQDNSTGDLQPITAANAKNYLADGVGVQVINDQNLAGEATGYACLTGHDRVSLGEPFGNTVDTYYFPFKLGKEITISHLAVDLYSSSAGGNRKIAIFEDSAGAPGDLVTNSNIIVDIGTQAYINTALAANITLAPGIYWVGMRGDANNGAAIRCSTGEAGFGIGISAPGVNIHQDHGVWCKATSSPTYAAFPEATASAVTYSGATTDIPYIIATLV